MSRFVRSSKFRHVYGNPYKKEECFDNIRITRNAWDSQYCAVNEKFVAVVVEAGGGGAFGVFKHDQNGKIDTDFPKVTGHKGPVLDIAFNPFNPNMIASASDDCTVKIWIIPDEGVTSNITEAQLVLNGHGRKVGQLHWHPVARDLLYSVSADLTIRCWNVATGKEVKCITGHTDNIYAMSFNRCGSQFITTSKDKKIRLFDTRSGDILHEKPGHEGSKISRCICLTDTNHYLTTGFSRQSDRQYKLLDEKLEIIAECNIDTASGLLLPFYDADLKILYLAGKGDGNIRYYEVNDSKPFVHFLTEFKTSQPQRGFGVMPKRGCNVGACEIARFYKLHPQNLVEPISMIVPRKSDAYQDDIFPDAIGDQPALSADEFLSGKTADPLRISLKDGFVPTKTADYVAPVVAKVEEDDTPKNAKEYEEAYHKLKAEVKRLQDELNTKDVEIRKLQASK